MALNPYGRLLNAKATDEKKWARGTEEAARQLLGVKKQTQSEEGLRPDLRLCGPDAVRGGCTPG